MKLRTGSKNRFSHLALGECIVHHLDNGGAPHDVQQLQSDQQESEHDDRGEVRVEDGFRHGVRVDPRQVGIDDQAGDEENERKNGENDVGGDLELVGLCEKIEGC